MIEEKGTKKVDAITNQNERSAALANKDDYKDDHKEIFEELVKERFDEIKESTDEINRNDSIYYFKGITFRKRFGDFKNGIELFKKIKSGEMKLEEEKNCRTHLNQI